MAKKNVLSLLDRSAQRAAEDVALKRRNVAEVEIVSGVERAVADEFVGAAVQLVGAGGGDDVDLRAGALAVLGAVGVAHDGEFAHGVHAEQLPADASRRVVDFRGAREFHAIEEVEILLRPAARGGEHVADHRIGGADAPGALRGVVDDAGIEREQLVVAAAVQRQVLHLLLAHQAGNVFIGDRDKIGMLGDGHALLELRESQGHIDLRSLAHHQA